MTDKLEVEFGFDLGALLKKKGSNFSNVKTEYVKEGESFYRIVPPAATDANRELNHRWVTHWITGANGKKLQAQCTYYTEKFCPLCAVAKQIDKELKGLMGTRQNFSELSAAEKEEANRLNEGKRQFEATRNVAYLAFNSSLEVVALKLSSTVSTLLDKKIFEAATVYGFDPTALNGGVWFKIVKVGKGRDTVTVDFKRIMSRNAAGKIVEELDQSPLPEDAMNKLNSARPDIHSHKDMWVKQFSAKQLGDFLKGTPLDLQSPELGGQLPLNPMVAEVKEVVPNDDQHESQVTGPSAQEMAQALAATKTTVAAPISTVAPVAQVVSPQSYAPTPSATPNVATASGTLAEQIARMRNLTKK